MPLYEYRTKTGGLITIKTQKPLTEKEKEEIERMIKGTKDATVDNTLDKQQFRI